MEPPLIYEYRCKDCDHITTKRRMMADRHDPCLCDDCGGDSAMRITGGQGFTAVMGAADNPGYMCPVTDQWVDSKRKRKEIMVEHDLREHSSADKVSHHSGYR